VKDVIPEIIFLNVKETQKSNQLKVISSEEMLNNLTVSKT